jgi:uncharacterized membrane protein
MYRKNLDLLVTAMVGLVSVVLGFNPIEFPPLNIGLGLSLALIFSGYAVVAAAFSRGAIGVPERVTLSVGLSIAISIVGGLLLNLTPWGIQRASWGILLGTITLVANLVAFVRRWRSGALRQSHTFVKITRRQALSLATAVLIAGFALAISVMGAKEQHVSNFTQLWITPANKAGEELVRIGISNQEQLTRNYRLQVTAQDNVVRVWPVIELAPGQKWEDTASLPPTGVLGTVEAELYLADDLATAYRTVALWRGMPTDIAASATPTSIETPTTETPTQPTATLVPVTNTPIVPSTPTVQPTDTPLPTSTGTATPTSTNTVVSTSTHTPTSQPTATLTASPTATPQLELGSTVTGWNGWSITTTSMVTATRLATTDPAIFYQPSGTYWVLRVEARNDTNQPRSLGATSDFVLRDATGRLHAELSNHGTAPGVREIPTLQGLSPMDVIVPPNGSITTLLIFDLPSDQQAAQLVGRIIQGNGVLSDNQVVWDLMSRP